MFERNLTEREISLKHALKSVEKEQKGADDEKELSQAYFKSLLLASAKRSGVSGVLPEGAGMIPGTAGILPGSAGFQPALRSS